MGYKHPFWYFFNFPSPTLKIRALTFTVEYKKEIEHLGLFFCISAKRGANGLSENERKHHRRNGHHFNQKHPQ